MCVSPGVSLSFFVSSSLCVEAITAGFLYPRLGALEEGVIGKDMFGVTIHVYE